MKFSCPSCKAKYQIADEKVIGKSLKMKCRKCGTYIPIQGKAATIAPTPSKSDEVRRPAPSPAHGGFKGAASSQTSSGSRGRPAPPRSGARAPRPASSSQRGPVAPAPPRIASRAPSSGEHLNLSLPAEAPAPPSIRHYRSGAEAGLPSMPASAKAPEPSEWYVGIAGQVVGPMSRSKVAERVRRGEVNAETYAWRDGQGEWQKIPALPVLADLLDEAPAPPSIPASAKHRAAVGAAAFAERPAEPAPISRQASSPSQTASRATPAGAAGKVSPATTGGAAPHASGEGFSDGEDRPHESAAAAAGGVREASPLTIGSQATAASRATGGSQATAGSAPATVTAATRTEQQPDSDDEQPFVIPRGSRGVGTGAIAAAVIGAVALGVAIGFAVFGAQGTKVIREVVEVPAAGPAETVPAPPAQGEVIIDEASGEEAKAGVSSGRVATTGSPAGSSSSSKTESPGSDKPLTGLSGLSGLNSGGPVGPSDSSASGSGGSELSSSQIQRTVSKYQASVKRGCWEPALTARADDAPSSARVSVSINVSPSGSVTSASSGGDPRGYPGLASCIERKVRTWRFPVSSGSTQVNVPFVFAGQ